MYEQYFGFSARPFQLTPDTKFYFESASQRQAMACLEYGLGQHEGFVVITGDAGTGKSTLVAQLLHQLDRSKWTIGQIVTSALDGEAIFEAAAIAFGIEVEQTGRAATLAALEQTLREKVHAGQRPLLVVDECQALDIAALEELRLLSNLTDEATPLLQIVLIGQQPFRSTLAHHRDLEQLRQRIIASHNLDPMNESETGKYVRHRLQQVGWPNRPTLGEGLMAALFAETNGVPRRIHQLMNRLLLLGAIEEKSELTTPMLQAVLAEMANEPAPAVQKQDLEQATQLVAEIAPEMPQEAAGLPDTDDRTAALEAAIKGLKAMAAAPPPVALATPADTHVKTAEIEEAIERIEQRLEEQEQSLRHVLTMLIEWLEDNGSREAA